MNDKTLFKQEVKGISIALLIYILIPALLSFLFATILFACNYPETETAMISTVLSMVTAAIFILQHYTKKFQITLPLNKPEPSFTWHVYLRYAVFALGIFWAMDIAFSLFSFLMHSYVQFATPDFTPNGSFIYQLFDVGYSILFAPIFEELIFRGMMFTKLQKYGNRFSILVVSLVFALFHGNLPQSIPTFFLSIGLCIMTLRSKSIYPAILTHIIGNTVGILSMVISQVIYIILLNAVIVAIIICAIVLGITYIKKHGIPKKDPESPKVYEFFTNWASILLSFYLILNMIAMINL